MRSLILAAAVAALPALASAATLTGDTVTINLTADDDKGTVTVLVGGGDDANFFGNQFIDFDDGADGDVFAIRSTVGFSSIDGVGGPVTWTMTGLDFSGGALLTGFELLTPFSDIAVVTTADSLTLSYEDIAIPSGDYIVGRFITSDVQPVPLPGAMAFLLAGLGGIALLGRRKVRD